MGLLEGFPEHFPPGNLEGNILTIHGVGFSVHQSHFDIDNGKTGNDAVRHGRLTAFIHAGSEGLVDRATENLIDKLVAPSRLVRFQIDKHAGKLTGPPGLLLMGIFHIFDGTGYTNGTILKKPGPIDLHTVLIARDLAGRKRYYANVKNLRLDGVDIDAGQIMSWNEENLSVRMVYFSVEPDKSYYYLEKPDDMQKLCFKHYFLTGGIDRWSCRARPGGRNYTPSEVPFCGEWAGEALQLGTSRYSVRIDIYEPSKPFNPLVSAVSPGKDQPEQATTVISGLGEVDSPLFQLTSYANLPGVGLSRDFRQSDMVLLKTYLKQRYVYGTILWVGVLPLNAETGKVYYDGTHLRAGNRVMRWETDVFPGDILSLPESSMILLYDDGDGVVSPDDRVMVKVKGPMSLCRLGDVLSGSTLLAYVSSGHEPSI